MADTDDLAALIRRLSDSEPGERGKSAAKLYLQAFEIVEPILSAWGGNPEFHELEHGGPFSKPEGYGPGNVIVGVAVEPRTFEMIRAANGSPPLAEVPPDQDAIEFELLFPKTAALDILTTRDPSGNGAIARFLRKSGEGIQQVERYVRDVDRATDILRRAGLQPIYPATRVGANGTRVNFFLVPTEQGGKVLIELVEDKDKT